MLSYLWNLGVALFHKKPTQLLRSDTWIWAAVNLIICKRWFGILGYLQFSFVLIPRSAITHFTVRVSKVYYIKKEQFRHFDGASSEELQELKRACRKQNRRDSFAIRRVKVESRSWRHSYFSILNFSIIILCVILSSVLYCMFDIKTMWQTLGT